MNLRSIALSGLVPGAFLTALALQGLVPTPATPPSQPASEGSLGGIVLRQADRAAAAPTDDRDLIDILTILAATGEL